MAFHYRKEIDGLRAIAVVPVVLFHAGFDAFAGGYVGVDVFFVISGYLITSIILKEQAEGRFTILNFYERRARRILPALFFVMICCLPFAWSWMAPHQLKDFAQSLVATTFFSSNIFFFLEADYFNPSSELSPLLHTWSLAVEEQYYLLFPPLLLLLWKLGVRVTLITFVVIFLASLAIAQIGAVYTPTANFYLLPSRMWELLVGVFAAFYLRDKGGGHVAVDRRVCDLMAAAGLLMILYAVVAFDEVTPFPGLWALFPTLGTLFIILFAIPGTLTGNLLGLRPLVLIGLISYSLYLWHQPLFAFARIRTMENVPIWMYFVLMLLSVLLAWLSYRVVERPFRNKSLTNRKQILAFVGCFALLFPSLGLLGHFRDGFINYQVNQIDVNLRGFVIDREAQLAARRAIWRTTLSGSRAPFDPETDGYKVLILGDSKSQDLFVSVSLNRGLFEEIQFRRQRFSNECMRSLDELEVDSIDNRICRNELTAITSGGLLEQADLVVLTNTWTAWTNAGVVELIESLQSRDKPVAVMGTGNFNDLTSLSMVIARQGLAGEALARYLFGNIKQDARMASLDLRDRIAGLNDVTYLEKLELFCDLEGSSCELFTRDGEPFIYDSGHVTILGAREYGRRLAERDWLLQLLTSGETRVVISGVGVKSSCMPGSGPVG